MGGRLHHAKRRTLLIDMYSLQVDRTHPHTRAHCVQRTLAVHWCEGGGEEKQLDVTMLYCCEIHKFLSRNKHKKIIKITNIISCRGTRILKKKGGGHELQTLRTRCVCKSEASLRVQDACSLGALAQNTRLGHVRSVSTGTRLRTFAQRGVALDQTRLWVSFALCHKQTRTVANLAYTSITSHLPNK